MFYHYTLRVTYTESEFLWLLVFLLFAIFKSLFSLIFCLATFPGSNMYVWNIFSELLRVHKDGFSA